MTRDDLMCAHAWHGLRQLHSPLAALLATLARVPWSPSPHHGCLDRHVGEGFGEAENRATVHVQREVRRVRSGLSDIKNIQSGHSTFTFDTMI